VAVERIDSHRFSDPDRTARPIIELHRRLAWDELSR
jgi:hypothetical protein